MLPLLQPDAVDTARYDESCGSKGSLGPEQRLMLAVLEDAIMCFQRHTGAQDGKGERLFLQAEEWIMEGDTSWSFSFENICDALRLDPAYIRRGLLLWKEERFVTGSLKNKRRWISRARMDGSRRIGNPRAA